MASNARKHTIPAGADKSFNRAMLFETFGNSINDVIPVANATDRAQVVSDLAAKGVGPTAADPLVVIRGDAPGLHRVEYSYDGSVWLPASGVLEFASKAAADGWGSANGGLLGVGDTCRIGGVEYVWWGTKWERRPLVVMRRTSTALAAASGQYTDLSASTGWSDTNGILVGATYSNGITVGVPGWYDVFWSMKGADGSALGLVGISVNAASGIGAEALHALAHMVSNVIVVGGQVARVKLAAGDVLRIFGYGIGGVMSIRAATGFEPTHWGCRWVAPA